MLSRKRIIIGLFTILALQAFTTPSNAQYCWLWFGNIGEDTLVASINDEFTIDVWFEGGPFSDFYAALATNDSCIDERLGGTYYYPFTDWDDAGFLQPQPDTPFEGWTNQAFMGWADLFGGPNPWLYFDEPTLILDFKVHTVDDTSIVGITFNALYGQGCGNAYTSNYIYFFLRGDVNGDGRINGSDVTYLVRHFKGYNEIPWPYERADCNGDGNVMGNDVTYLVRYFRGVGPPP